MECGCYPKINWKETTIVFCPLHAAAEETTRALEGVLVEIPKDMKALGALVDPVSYSYAISRGRMALATAKGG